jgi:hypothetical protein
MKGRYGIIDVAIFIWDSQNPTKFFEISTAAIRLFAHMRREQTTLLLSEELMAIVLENYPNNDDTTHKLRGFKNALYQLLGAIPKQQSLSAARGSVVGPNEIKRDYFTDPRINSEIDRIETTIVDAGEGKMTFFSFQKIWDIHKREIRFVEGSHVVRVEVVLGDMGDEIDRYFLRKMCLFDPEAQKHLVREGYILPGGRQVSPLSAYVGKNVERCQKLIDESLSEKGDTKRFNWDCENCVWVVFRRSTGGEPDYRGNVPYHGHDETDETNIPPDILRKKSDLEKGCRC